MINSKQIYFAGAIRGGREDAPLYLKIIEELTKYGQVLTEHVGNKDLIDTGESHLTDGQIHDRDMKWIRSSDVVIAEVSTPSLGVGYEIAAALELGKPVYCLFNRTRGSRLSAMIRGDQRIVVMDYRDFGDIQTKLQGIFS